MRIAKRNSESGFTLVEALIALVVLTVGMLAIFEGLVLYTHMNLINLCRDEAVRIAEERMNHFRGMGLAPSSGSETISRRVRNFSRNFVIKWNAEKISPQSLIVKLDVSWNIAGREYVHSTVSIISGLD